MNPLHLLMLFICFRFTGQYIRSLPASVMFSLAVSQQWDYIQTADSKKKHTPPGMHSVWPQWLRHLSVSDLFW